jgi:hypothetical protein
MTFFLNTYKKEDKAMYRRTTLLFLISVLILPFVACSPKIYGTVKLLDTNMMPVMGESPKGTVVNMINTTASLEEASHSVTVDEEGKFESAQKALKSGIYKIEANRMDYITETKTVEIGCCSGEEVNLNLKKIHIGKRKSIEASRSDEDKIINPGEVNIQPPIM